MILGEDFSGLQNYSTLVLRLDTRILADAYDQWNALNNTKKDFVTYPYLMQFYLYRNIWFKTLEISKQKKSF